MISSLALVHMKFYFCICFRIMMKHIQTDIRARELCIWSSMSSHAGHWASTQMSCIQNKSICSFSHTEGEYKTERGKYNGAHEMRTHTHTHPKHAKFISYMWSNNDYFLCEKSFLHGWSCCGIVEPIHNVSSFYCS